MLTEELIATRTSNGEAKYLKRYLCSDTGEMHAIDTSILIQGSSVRVTSEGKTYLFDEQNREWLEVSGGCF